MIKRMWNALWQWVSWQWVLFIIVLSLPILFYAIHFRDLPISNNPVDWANFGSYIGGVYAVLVTFLAILLTRHLKNARTFVLKVIPAVSYMCGIIIQILLAWHEDQGVSREEMSSDIKAFASCVKEGVTNYDMLMMKYRGKMMRVECHNRKNR